jgi:hypothetical protein
LFLIEKVTPVKDVEDAISAIAGGTQRVAAFAYRIITPCQWIYQA